MGSKKYKSERTKRYLARCNQRVKTLKDEQRDARNIFQQKRCQLEVNWKRVVELGRSPRWRRSEAFKQNVRRFGLRKAKFIAVFIRDKIYGHGVRPGRGSCRLGASAEALD